MTTLFVRLSFANLVAEAYLEGAKEHEAALRTQTDKGSDVAKEARTAIAEKQPDRRPRRAPGKAEPKKAEGPVVVKVSKQRKLVAAGMAEVVEIQAELENQDDKKEDVVESKF